jgi:putative hydrolase of the HAD superfamily
MSFPMPRLTTIALDADDTLWQNEQFFRITEKRFVALLRDYTDMRDLNERLIQATARNLAFYGFGAKGFTLSMVETALDVTNHRVPGNVIAEIMAAGRELLNFPIETLPYVDQALDQLQEQYRLILRSFRSGAQTRRLRPCRIFRGNRSGIGQDRGHLSPHF